MTLSYDKILLRAALCMLTLLLTGACSRRGPVLTFREADDPTPAPSCPAPRRPNAA